MLFDKVIDFYKLSCPILIGEELNESLLIKYINFNIGKVGNMRKLYTAFNCWWWDIKLVSQSVSYTIQLITTVKLINYYCTIDVYNIYLIN